MRIHGIHWGYAALVWITLAFPASAWSQGHELDRSVTHDVAIGADGQLAGQVVTNTGMQMADVTVLAIVNGRSISVVTDSAGRFQLPGVGGGLVHLSSGPGSAVYRAWAPGTAPPVADASARLVVDRVVRGQSVCPAPCRIGALSALGLGIAGITAGFVLPSTLNSADAS